MLLLFLSSCTELQRDKWTAASVYHVRQLQDSLTAQNVVLAPEKKAELEANKATFQNVFDAEFFPAVKGLLDDSWGTILAMLGVGGGAGLGLGALTKKKKA